MITRKWLEWAYYIYGCHGSPSTESAMLLDAIKYYTKLYQILSFAYPHTLPAYIHVHWLCFSNRWQCATIWPSPHLSTTVMFSNFSKGFFAQIWHVYLAPQQKTKCQIEEEIRSENACRQSVYLQAFVHSGHGTRPSVTCWAAGIPRCLRPWLLGSCSQHLMSAVVLCRMAAQTQRGLNRECFLERSVMIVSTGDSLKAGQLLVWDYIIKHYSVSFSCSVMTVILGPTSMNNFMGFKN